MRVAHALPVLLSFTILLACTGILLPPRTQCLRLCERRASCLGSYVVFSSMLQLFLQSRKCLRVVITPAELNYQAFGYCFVSSPPCISVLIFPNFILWSRPLVRQEDGRGHPCYTMQENAKLFGCLWFTCVLYYLTNTWVHYDPFCINETVDPFDHRCNESGLR